MGTHLRFFKAKPALHIHPGIQAILEHANLRFAQVRKQLKPHGSYIIFLSNFWHTIPRNKVFILINNN